MSTITPKTSGMEKAFRTVRGALERGDAVELRCKKIWLERVLHDLPSTTFAHQAEDALLLVNDALRAAAPQPIRREHDPLRRPS